MCCANRGTFIKVGQHLGALDYLLPQEYTSTLKVLHSRAPQSTMDEIQQVIREDLGKEVSVCEVCVCAYVSMCECVFTQVIKPEVEGICFSSSSRRSVQSMFNIKFKT